MRVSEILVKRIRVNQGLGVFWEGHKILRNLHHRFDRYYIVQMKSTVEISQKFVGFSEYVNFMWILKKKILNLPHENVINII